MDAARDDATVGAIGPMLRPMAAWGDGLAGREGSDGAWGMGHGRGAWRSRGRRRGVELKSGGDGASGAASRVVVAGAARSALCRRTPREHGRGAAGGVGRWGEVAVALTLVLALAAR